MDSISTFVCKSRFSTSVDNLFHFHESEQGFDSLVASVPGITVLEKPKSLQIDERAVMMVPIFPLIKVKWIAQHTKYEKNVLFQDTQIQGPFSFFRHTHLFHKENQSALLEDSIEFKAAFSFASKYIVSLILSRQFKERHQITARVLGVKSELLYCGRI